MAIEVEKFGSFLVILYEEFLQSLPSWAQNFMNLFLLSFLIVLYAILIWKFYRWIAKKDILELNLNRYNQLEHSIFAKAIAGLIYFLEYLIILPVVVFIWFSLFTIFLMLLTENLEIQTILISSVTVVTAIRITSYYKEDLSRDLAKLLPLTLLAVGITRGLINFENVISQISLIPSFLDHIGIYFLFILAIEIFLRTIYLIFSATGLLDEKEIKSKDD